MRISIVITCYENWNRFDSSLIAPKFEVRVLLFFLLSSQFSRQIKDKEAKIWRFSINKICFGVFLVKSMCYTAIAILNVFISRLLKNNNKKWSAKIPNWAKLSNFQGHYSSRVIILCHYENANLRTFLIDVSTPSFLRMHKSHDMVGGGRNIRGCNGDWPVRIFWTETSKLQ